MKSCVGGAAGAKLERKTVEKNRRLRMKSLSFKLSSLIPKEQCPNSKDALPQLDLLDLAVSYKESLKKRMERLKQDKELAMSIKGINENINKDMMIGIKMPVIQVNYVESTLEVLIISELNRRFMFHEVFSVLAEEGADVVNASFSIVTDKIFYTIHSKAICARIGLDDTRVSERLKELVQ